MPAGISIRYTVHKALGQEARITVYCSNKTLGCFLRETGICFLEVKETSPLLSYILYLKMQRGWKVAQTSVKLQIAALQL